MNHPIMFLDGGNKTKIVPASFSYFLKLLWEKNKFQLKKCDGFHYSFRLSIIKKLIELFYLHCFYKKVVEKSNKENLKVIKITLPNKSGNP